MAKFQRNPDTITKARNYVLDKIQLYAWTVASLIRVIKAKIYELIVKHTEILATNIL